MIASIPSPTEGVWYLGPAPIRAYALTIMLGIVVAIWVGERRWIARGGRPGDVLDIAIWAVPFGIVGARVYHLITDWDNYFAAGREPLEALRIWEGGLSIWGAIAAGVLGGWIAARRKGIPFPALADAVAPGIVLAQAIGRVGNYFNNELYGRPTDLPWGLEVHQMDDFRAVRDATGAPVLVEGGPFHPIFLYESLWAVGTALVLIWADRRFQMGHGRVFALYVALYTAGRTWIENLRIDDGGDVAGPAREFLGMRINAWVSVVLMVGSILYIVISARLRPGRETIDLPPLDGSPAPAVAADSAGDGDRREDADKAADTAGAESATAVPDGEAAATKVQVGDDGDNVSAEPAVATLGGDRHQDEQGAETASDSPAVEPESDDAKAKSASGDTEGSDAGSDRAKATSKATKATSTATKTASGAKQAAADASTRGAEQAADAGPQSNVEDTAETR